MAKRTGAFPLQKYVGKHGLVSFQERTGVIMRLFGLMIQQSTVSFKGGFYGIQTLLIWDVKTRAYSRLDPHTSQIGLVTTLKAACRLRTLVCGGRPQFDTQYFGQLWNIFSGEKNISHGKKKTQFYSNGGKRLW